MEIIESVFPSMKHLKVCILQAQRANYITVSIKYSNEVTFF